jgi:hypothetical protein
VLEACVHCGERAQTSREYNDILIFRCSPCQAAVIRGMAVEFCYVCGADRCCHPEPISERTTRENRF